MPTEHEPYCRGPTWTGHCTCGLAQRREIENLKLALLDQTGRYLDAVNEAHRHHRGVVERDNEIATLRELVEVLTVLSEARRDMLDALQDMVRLEAPHIAQRIAAAREAER